MVGTSRSWAACPLSLSLSLLTHLALLVWLRFRFAFGFASHRALASGVRQASHRSRLRNLEQVFGCQPTSGRFLSCSSVPSFPTPQVSLDRAVRPERLGTDSHVREPFDWEKQWCTRRGKTPSNVGLSVWKQQNFCENECVVRQRKFFSKRRWVLLGRGKLEKLHEERRKKQEALVRRLVESADEAGKV